MPGQRHSVHTLAGLSAQWEKVADFVLAVVGGYRHCYFAFLVGGAIVPGDRFVRRSQQERIRAKSTVRQREPGTVRYRGQRHADVPIDCIGTGTASCRLDRSCSALP